MRLALLVIALSINNVAKVESKRSEVSALFLYCITLDLLDIYSLYQ